MQFFSAFSVRQQWYSDALDRYFKFRTGEKYLSFIGFTKQYYHNMKKQYQKITFFSSHFV